MRQHHDNFESREPVIANHIKNFLQRKPSPIWVSFDITLHPRRALQETRCLQSRKSNFSRAQKSHYAMPHCHSQTQALYMVFSTYTILELLFEPIRCLQRQPCQSYDCCSQFLYKSSADRKACLMWYDPFADRKIYCYTVATVKRSAFTRSRSPLPSPSSEREIILFENGNSTEFSDVVTSLESPRSRRLRMLEEKP